MYNEYPDLVLEGLMYDLSIVQEGDNGNKNIFQKFVAFLKRIGAWFVKMFKKLADKFRGAGKNSGELTDEELFKIEVANYDIPTIEKIIKISEIAFKKIDEFIGIRKKLQDEKYKNTDNVRDYIEKVEIFFTDQQFNLITDITEINKFKNSLENKTKCDKKIYNFMVDTFKNIKNSDINKISDNYAIQFSRFSQDATHTVFIENFPKGFITADSHIMNTCTNILNLSAIILTQIYDDLIIISNGIKDGSDKVYIPDKIGAKSTPHASY